MRGKRQRGKLQVTSCKLQVARGRETETQETRTAWLQLARYTQRKIRGGKKPRVGGEQITTTQLSWGIEDGTEFGGEVFGFVWLLDEAVDGVEEARVFDHGGAVAAANDNFEVGVFFFENFEDRLAGHLRHVHIEQNEIVRIGSCFDLLNGLASVARDL